MQGKELDNYIAYFEGLVHLAGCDPNDHLCLKYFTDGLPTGLYQDVLKLDRPRNYREWKEATIDCQGLWEHINHQQERQQNMGRPHPGMFDPFSSILVCPSRCDPDAMDTTADRGRSRGKVRRAEPKDKRKGRPSSLPTQRRGHLPPFQTARGLPPETGRLAEMKGSANVITANSSNTLVASAPRNRRKEAPAKSNRPTKKTSRRKIRPMPY